MMLGSITFSAEWVTFYTVVNLLGLFGLCLMIWGFRRERVRRYSRAVTVAAMLAGGAVLYASDVPSIDWCERWFSDHGYMYYACCVWYGNCG